jgi:acetyl-CoA carboxylase biotin carboxyl carrier protein
MTPEEIKALAEVLDKVPGIKGVDFKDVRRLTELLRAAPEIGSIELKGWFGTGVVITRTASGPAQVASMAMLPAAAAPAAHSAGVPSGEAADLPKPAASSLKEIKSPMVGTFYASPEPGAEPYAKAGMRVTPGQTVCIIEAMKIMNEIEAEFGGVIREICVDDAQPVEFGQVLFRVDPHA